MLRPHTRGLTAAFVLLLLFGCSRTVVDDNFRADVVDCEEALAHLQDCCGLAATNNVKCIYYFSQDSCDSTIPPDETRPDLTVDVSDCIRAHSCAELTLTCDSLAARAGTPYATVSCP